MSRRAFGIAAIPPIVAALNVAPAAAHEAGAPFAGSIIDPLVLHHAHIENEQRINLFALRGVDRFDGRRGAGTESELELAWSRDDFRLGAEVFVPFSRIPSPGSDGTQTGLGDIEIRPVKYSFVSEADFVLSTATGLTLPTGRRDRGLGAGDTVLAQYLFADKAIGNWFVGVNFSVDVRLNGNGGGSVGYGGVMAYSFIKDTSSDGVAKSRPKQAIVVAPSVEFFGKSRLSGGDASGSVASVLPGVTFWWPESGWQLHLGVSFPVTGAREADRIFLIQLGNHLNWGRLLSGHSRD